MHFQYHTHFAALRLLAIALFLLAAGCAPSPAAPPPVTAQPATPAPATAAVTAAVPTAAPSVPTAAPTATLAPPQVIALRPGDFYFSVDGTPGFTFSRNLAGYTLQDFDTLLPMSNRGGTRIARIQVSTVVAGGMGYTSAGAIDDAWAEKWSRVFDAAEANGVYVWVVFTGWYDWNTTGLNSWAGNPFNAANGGPAAEPTELFRSGSETQALWLEWLGRIVARWQRHKSILVWESYSEVNLTQGVSEPDGLAFVEAAAAVIRAADPSHRPLTASPADVSAWPSLYRSDALDFINIHPYPVDGMLDTKIIADVHDLRATYGKPVMIGESGLSAEPPSAVLRTLTTAPRAGVGTRHAVWAAVVSGAANGRALYWEDGYALYFPSLSWDFINKNAALELPALNFTRDVDFSGFAPLAVRTTEGITGGAVGNEQSVIGWFRDAGCEPPDWPVQPSISGQRVTLGVPGTAVNWQVDFYSTATGTDIVHSANATRTGDTIEIALPDFSDDIAFKLRAKPGPAATSAPAPTAASGPANTDPIAGAWTGTVTSESGSFSAALELSIAAGCKPGSICGTVSVPQIPCSGDLMLAAIEDDTFVFEEQRMGGSDSCVSGGYEYLRLQAGGTLSYRYEFTTASGEKIASNGELHRR